VGGPLITLLTPGLGAGIMVAGRLGAQGTRVSPIVLFSGFLADNKKNLPALLILGLIYTACITLIQLLLHVVLGAQPQVDVDVAQNSANPEQLVELSQYMATYMPLFALTTIPVTLAFWYAPALVVWNKMKPMQALFSSWVGIWRNKSAFLVYGLGWLLLSVGVSSIAIGLLKLVGLPETLIAAMYMVAMTIIIAISFCTFYPSYRSVFESRPKAIIDIQV